MPNCIKCQAQIDTGGVVTEDGRLLCPDCEKSETRCNEPLPPGWPVVAGMTLSTVVERTPLGPAFKGVQPRLGTEVVVTLLSPAIALHRPDLMEMLFANVRTVAQLQTPHLVRILDANAEGNTYYIVEEAVRGMTAQAFLAKKVVSVGRGLEEAEAPFLVVWVVGDLCYFLSLDNYIAK